MEELYNAVPNDILEATRRVLLKIVQYASQCTLRNPASDTARSWSPGLCPTTSLVRKFPTGGLAVLRLDGDTWGTVVESKGDCLCAPKT